MTDDFFLFIAASFSSAFGAVAAVVTGAHLAFSIIMLVVDVFSPDEVAN